MKTNDTHRLSAAIDELAAAAGEFSTLREAVGRIAVSSFGVRTAEVIEGGAGLPLTSGLTLAVDGEVTHDLATYAQVAGVLLGEAMRFEQATSDYSAVLARLDQLHRDLDNAQRAEWVALERSRIAQDLHDRVAQTLFGIGLKADWLLTHLERDEHLRPDLQLVKGMAATGLRQVRDAIFSLSSAPVEAAQLKQVVQGLLKELESVGINGDFQVWGDVQAMPPDVTDALYQLIREALVNVRRHSGAKTVLVSARIEPHQVTAVVQDDGKGPAPGVLETFRENGAHMGLRGMEGRVTRLGGNLHLAPGDECGLVVTAHIPLMGGPQHG